MAIPIKSLRYPGRKEGEAHRWGFQIRRKITSKDERVVWAPVSRNVMSFLAQIGILDGITNLSTERNFEVLPTFTAIGSGRLDTTTGEFESDHVEEGGVGLKYGLSSNLTLDFTYNPDFSQIESDNQQIQVNNRFPINFPELRPFFLEGREIFEFPGQPKIVETRRIVDPRYAAKLSGKVGSRTSIGVLVADDEAPGKVDSVTDPAYGKSSTSVVRPRQVRSLPQFACRHDFHRSRVHERLQPARRRRPGAPPRPDAELRLPVLQGGPGRKWRREDRVDVDRGRQTGRPELAMAGTSRRPSRRISGTSSASSSGPIEIRIDAGNFLSLLAGELDSQLGAELPGSEHVWNFDGVLQEASLQPGRQLLVCEEHQLQCGSISARWSDTARSITTRTPGIGLGHSQLEPQDLLLGQLRRRRRDPFHHESVSRQGPGLRRDRICPAVRAAPVRVPAEHEPVPRRARR